MNVVKSTRENGDTIIRVTHRTHKADGGSKHGAYHVTKDGVFRVYYTDNQKRFPILQQVMEV